MDTTLMLTLGLTGIFAGIVLVFAGLGVGVTERTGVGRSLAAIQALGSATPDLRSRELDRPFGERVIIPTTARLSTLGRRLTPADQAERLQRRLDLAGNPTGWDVDRVLAFKVLGIASGAMLGFILPWLYGASFGMILLIGVGGTALGYFLPNLVLKQMSNRRSQRIQRELPDGLDLMTISVESGLAFDAAVAQVARNTEGPLADEFFRVLSEMQIGKSRMDALRGLGERTDVEDLKLFVTAMVQADSFGIPIADVLRTQSREMRVRRRQRAEERAQKIPVKITIPLIFCVLPTMFIIIIGPAAINISQNLLGSL